MKDVLPASNSDYHDKEYWDTRYETEGISGSFDWFKSYVDVKEHMNRLIPNKEARIIMLGCGNSTLSKDMYDDGFHNIVNVDYSPVVIELMSLKYASDIGMTWVVADVTALPFEASSFDIAIDKATMDALMTVNGDVWDPPPEVMQACKGEVDEVIRILNSTGSFIYLSYGQPHFRKMHLMREGWGLEIVQLGLAFFYYIYIMKRTLSVEVEQRKKIEEL